ncbi:hypothetical protein ACP70R_026149 [Stipagrostis hirtigluma subsp. patula]
MAANRPGTGAAAAASARCVAVRRPPTQMDALRDNIPSMPPSSPATG